MGAVTYYKILLFMKRRPDMSVAAFRDYYENHHVPLCLKYAAGMKRYIRRFIEPLPHPETGVWSDPFDVITELWFDDKAIFEGTLKYITTTIMPAEIVSDENNLFDRASFRLATVTEIETDLSNLKN
ncbi:MAG TPA: EthD domain-containing protein [Spongiibacteraceae bacterium]|nr:EthD domain-containing protein [Spongiibacteraceae bacterium]